MSRYDSKVREAFDELEKPEGLDERTLAFIAKKAAKDPEAEPVDFGSALSSHDFRVEEGGTQVQAPSKRRRRGSLFAVAACLALILLGVGVFSAAMTPQAYASFTGETSIELGVNRFGTVVAVKALDEEGQALLDTLAESGISLRGRGYVDAVELLAGSEGLGLSSTEDAPIEVTLVCRNPDVAESLASTTQDCFVRADCPYYCDTATDEEYAQAQALGIGVARYRAALQLSQLDPDLSLEDCAAMSMRELRDRIAAAETGEDYIASQGAGNGRGYGQRQGLGQGAGYGQGNGSGLGQGLGQGQGQGQGAGSGAGGGQGQGQSSSD